MKMTCLQESDKKWVCDNCLNLVDASKIQSIGHDAGDAGQSTRCSMTIAMHNDFDWVHEMASVSLAINSKRMGFVASPGAKDDQLFSRRAGRTWPHSKRHIFATCHAFAVQFSQWTPPWIDLSIDMLIKAIAPVLAEKIGNMWTDKILSFSGSSKG